MEGKTCISLSLKSPMREDLWRMEFEDEISENERSIHVPMITKNIEIENSVKKAFEHIMKTKIGQDETISDDILQVIHRSNSNEQKQLPNSFLDILISYFDDMFVYAETYKKAILALKVVLEAARIAGIKFSAEKTSFLTKKIKVLGYNYNTDSLRVTMDKNKASAFLNMKKPSSLYELHSRLASFQYQQAFLLISTL